MAATNVSGILAGIAGTVANVFAPGTGAIAANVVGNATSQMTIGKSASPSNNIGSTGVLPPPSQPANYGQSFAGSGKTAMGGAVASSLPAGSTAAPTGSGFTPPAVVNKAVTSISNMGTAMGLSPATSSVVSPWLLGGLVFTASVVVYRTFFKSGLY